MGSRPERPHPLAAQLVHRLRAQPDAYVLDLGCGRGRNTDALESAGHRVYSVADDRVHEILTGTLFDAAISTHALLHGTRESCEALLSSVARSLKPAAPFYAAFASSSDARFGKGVRIDAQTFAPLEGDEHGVPHVYFDRVQLQSLLEPHFVLESLEQRAVDEVVGSWAHPVRPAGTVHWFVRAHHRDGA